MSVFHKTKNVSQHNSLPDAVMRNKHDKNEIYNELVWNNYKRNEIQMKWKLRNPKQTSWPRKMQLVPILAFPPFRASMESSVCQLDGFDSGELNVKMQLPHDFMTEYLIVVFKLKTATEELVGPTLINYIKILPADASQGSAKKSSEAELIVIGQALSE